MKRSKFNIVLYDRRWKAGFSLIELLVVISIIALFAALIVPFTARVFAKRTITRVQIELYKLDSAIESYKATLGVYPPGNLFANRWTNKSEHFATTLFYELTGCTNNVDVMNTPIKIADLKAATGNEAILNSPEMGGPGRNFFGSVRPDQHAVPNTSKIREFVVNVPGPEPTSGPVYDLEKEGRIVNPWNYDPSSTNKINADRFDLWVDIFVGKRIYRICNWSPEPVILR
jgi:prepilin-type N-terminal cleavage/methylation domain-containing protein